jgi:group II intron reverse transcriptase/maturase
MERRGQQSLDRNQCSQTDRSVRYFESKELALNSWVRIRLHANRGKDATFNNLLTHFNVENFREAFRALDGSKAKGMDGVTKGDYSNGLDDKLANLENRIHKGTFRPQPKKEVLIPKANGKTRPIAISAFEDKIVEWTLGKVLESVYEPVFIRNSFGFRPKKSAHNAIEASYLTLKDNKRPFVVEIDLKSFFNTVSHRKLMKILQIKIQDPRLLGLIARFLKAEIHHVEDDLAKSSDVGTPQGSVMSPILANIYLHYVLDEWFLRNYASHTAVIVRYADDAIFMFDKKEKADRFLSELRDRLSAFELELNEEKTTIVDFTRGKNGIFHFLGFSLYWAKRFMSPKLTLSIKTHREKLHKKMDDYTLWIKKNRSYLKTKTIWERTKLKLIGHYNYYGYYCNRRSLWRYYHHVTWNLFRWLNRRSQKRSFSWEKFKTIIASSHVRLPTPPLMKNLKQLGWNPYA